MWLFWAQKRRLDIQLPHLRRLGVCSQRMSCWAVVHGWAWSAMRRKMGGSCTYDGVTLSDTHAITQLVERLHILLSALAHGNIFYYKALIAPCLHSLDIELFVFRCDVQHRRAAPKRQPAIAVG